MKHLITGGSGFLGNLIAEELLKKGEEVCTFDTREDPKRPQAVNFWRGDVRDSKEVARALRGIDYVHHTAALVPLTKSGQDFHSVNVEGSRIVAEEAARAKVKGFIHTSSSAVYGLPEDNPITSQTKLEPIEIYGRSKFEAEKCVREICQNNNIPLIVVRPRTILGKGRLGIFKILFDWIHEGRKIYVIGSGNHDFQFVHATDLISAYILLLEKNKPGIYNIGTPHYGTLREGLENLITHAKSRSKVVGLPQGLTITTLKILDKLNLSPLAPWHYMTYHKPFCFDVSELLSLGWKPLYSNDAMLAEGYDWFLKNKDSIKEGSANSVHRSPVKEKLLKLLKLIS